jgi:hypothetical protein
MTERFPALSLESIRRAGGRKHVPERRKGLAKLLMSTLRNDYPHWMNPWDGTQAFSFKYLKNVLRCDRPARLEALLSPLFCWRDCRNGGCARAFRLRPDVERHARQLLGGQFPLAVIDQCTGVRLEPWQYLPKNGAPEHLELPLPGTLDGVVGLLEIDRAIERLKRWVEIHGYEWAALNPEKPNGRTLAQGLTELRLWRQWFASLGAIPNWYVESDNGRLDPFDLAPSLVNVPSIIRKLLLEKSGLFDHDLRACHWSIVASYAHSHGIAIPTVDSYLSDRNAWHARLSALTGGSTQAIKHVLLSILNGGRLVSAKRTRAGQLLGADALREDPGVNQVRKEAKKVLAKMVRSSIREGAIVNGVGKALAAPSSYGQTTSHILFGIEQLAIRAMCGHVEGLVAVVYDGWISPKQDIAKLERAARDACMSALGWPLEVSITVKPFSDGAPDPVRNEADF